MQTDELTKDVLDADCWRYGRDAVRLGTWQAAELYEKHIALFEDYLRGRRVLN